MPFGEKSQERLILLMLFVLVNRKENVAGMRKGMRANCLFLIRIASRRKMSPGAHVGCPCGLQRIHERARTSQSSSSYVYVVFRIEKTWAQSKSTYKPKGQRSLVSSCSGLLRERPVTIVTKKKITRIPMRQASINRSSYF